MYRIIMNYAYKQQSGGWYIHVSKCIHAYKPIAASRLIPKVRQDQGMSLNKLYTILWLYDHERVRFGDGVIQIHNSISMHVPTQSHNIYTYINIEMCM